MFHMIWYAIIGLVAGVVAKAVMHVQLTMFWTIVLGLIGSVVSGAITHMLFPPREGARFHPAGLILSILGAILVLYVCQKMNIQFPHVHLPHVTVTR
jgi:uncharacterized membrane protein YeaQ/YmgE (transglycosylase-associated protein family)